MAPVARRPCPAISSCPRLDPHDYFTSAQLHRADRYERFHRVNWLLATIVLFAALGWYAVRGARFVRESAAGRIGTGMLLAMLGFGIVWLVQVPFAVAGNWWDRRHGVSKVGYFDEVFGGWLQLGVEFVFLSLSVLIVMGLAGIVGDWWWIPGSLVFVGLATLFLFVQPYTVTDAHRIHDPQLAADVRELARAEGVSDVPVSVEDVDKYTSAANAYATGLGPSRKVFLWNTLLDGRFSRREVRVVVAHEFGHQARNHLWKGVAWYALFAIPGRLGDRPRHTPAWGDARAGSGAARADHSRGAHAAGTARRERHLAPHGGGGGLAGARDDEGPGGGDLALPELLDHEPRRSDPSGLGLRHARDASAAPRPHGDGARLAGAEPWRAAVAGRRSVKRLAAVPARARISD